jgi:flagellar transcriptional activator FlhD
LRNGDFRETKGIQMTADHLLDEIRDANMTYLLLAQSMLRTDKAQALYRLGISEDIGEILEALSTAQILKIAGANTMVCRFRFDDRMVWDLLTSHSKDRGVAGVHAAILMAGQAAETV